MSDQTTSSHEQSYTDVLEDGVADNHYLYDVSDSLWEVPKKSLERVRASLYTENLHEFDLENSGARTTSSAASSSPRIPASKRKASTSHATSTLANHTTTRKNPKSSVGVKSSALNVDSTQSYADTNFSLAAEVHRTRVRLAQLENIMGKESADPTLWCGIEGHEDWLERPPPVGPSLETERPTLAAKAAERLRFMLSSKSEITPTRKRKF